ncbi:hypothetical protein GCM10020258_42260 [Sphingomonas yabuuchiae]
MHGQDGGGERAERLDGLGHRVRYVVQLQVEEDGQADMRHLAHAGRTMRTEEFQAQLQPADMMADLLRQRLCASEIGVSMAT